ncbi:MAG: MFS transporter [Bryobacteraceae bacterium]
MTYARFVHRHGAALSFGILVAFASSFGQTFFISLFVPSIGAEFGLDKSGIGSLYGFCTVVSALLLPHLGSRIDTAPLRRYASLSFAGLAAAALLVAAAPNYWVLGLGIAGLRLSGQGLMSHIAQTVMARELGPHRGKALAIAGIGYPLGEAVLPIAIASALAWGNWRVVWGAVAAVAVAVILPGALHLLKRSGLDGSAAGRIAGTMRPKTREWLDIRFFLALPAMLVQPFVITGLFLYQLPIAESRGWSPQWIAGAFVAFAAARAFTTLLAGPLIDRFSGVRLLAIHLLPFALGIGILLVGSHPWLAFVYMTLLGVSVGAGSAIGSAVWAELYGTAQVGTVRSFATSFGVLSTALSPPVLGWLLERTSSIEPVLGLTALGVALVALLTQIATIRLRERPPVSDEPPVETVVLAGAPESRPQVR